jgi:hypothetical protein
MSDLQPDLKARILEAARDMPSPTRASTRAQSWLVAPSGIIVAASLFFAFHGPEHGEGRPAWFYLASTFGWAGVAALSVWGALGRSGSATGRSRGVLWAITIGTPALLFAMMFALGTVDPSVTSLHPERLGLKCLGLTVAAAAFPLVALLMVRRDSDAVHPLSMGAALGAACGASAGVMVEMWCPVNELHHVALGHILPILALSIIGAGLGARMLSMRARAPARSGDGSG